MRSILGVQRRTYHRLVAEAMESLYEDHIESSAEVLATHCAAAGRFIDAARYVHIAGQRLEKSQFLERARTLYERGLAYIAEVDDTPATWDARVQGEAMLSFRSGALSRLLGEEKRAERALQVALDISSDAGLPWIEIRTHLELGRLYLTRGKVSLAEAHIGQASSLARIEADLELRVETMEAAANLAYEQGHNDRAEQLWREALANSGDDAGAAARCHLGMASRRIREGDLDSATVLLEKALPSARASNDRILVGRVLNNMGLLHYWSGHFDEALAAFRDALHVREGIGYTAGVVINHHNIGDVHFSRGDLARAWVAFSRSRELAEAMDWRRGIVLNDVYLGYIDAVRDGIDGGLERILGAAEQARGLGDIEIAANGAMLAARVLQEHGRGEAARTLLDSAQSDAETYGLNTLLASIAELREELD
jgi:tetratricopeptide (TPR) repeat protein